MCHARFFSIEKRCYYAAGNFDIPAHEVSILLTASVTFNFRDNVALRRIMRPIGAESSRETLVQ